MPIGGDLSGLQLSQCPAKEPNRGRHSDHQLERSDNSSQTQVLNEVKQASRLPSAVLDKLGGIADPGQPFNTTCAVDSKLPMRQLFVAAVSENYCIVS